MNNSNIEYSEYFNSLNKEFYKSIASDFDDSRQFYWDGWYNLKKILNDINTDQNLEVLDLACGNGRFAGFLIDSGFKINYLGIDSDSFLIDKGRSVLQDLLVKDANFKENLNENRVQFIKADILQDNILESSNFRQSFSGFNTKFDLVVSFGFLHHIASLDLRRNFFKDVAKGVKNNGIVVLTSWNFLKNPNLMKRVLAFPGDRFNGYILKENDYILDWKRRKIVNGDRINENRIEDNTARFCHFYTKDEIASLSNLSGLKCIKHYQADGKNNDNDYWVFTKY